MVVFKTTLTVRGLKIAVVSNVRVVINLASFPPTPPDALHSFIYRLSLHTVLHPTLRVVIRHILSHIMRSLILACTLIVSSYLF